MATVSREVKEGEQLQGADEQIVYTLTTTNWGSSPGTVSVVAKDMTNAETDVSTTVLSGSATVVADVITLPVLKSLTRDHRYRVEVKFTCGTSIFEAYFYVLAQL